MGGLELQEDEYRKKGIAAKFSCSKTAVHITDGKCHDRKQVWSSTEDYVQRRLLNEPGSNESDKELVQQNPCYFTRNR